MFDIISDVTNGTRPLFSGEFVRWERLSQSTQVVGIGSKGLNRPPGVLEQPDNARIEGRKGTLSKCLPRATKPPVGVSVPLELVKAHGLVIAGRMNLRVTFREQSKLFSEYCVEHGVGSKVEPGVSSNVLQDTNG